MSDGLLRITELPNLKSSFGGISVFTKSDISYSNIVSLPLTFTLTFTFLPSTLSSATLP